MEFREVDVTGDLSDVEGTVLAFELPPDTHPVIAADAGALLAAGLKRYMGGPASLSRDLDYVLRRIPPKDERVFNARALDAYEGKPWTGTQADGVTRLLREYESWKGAPAPEGITG